MKTRVTSLLSLAAAVVMAITFLPERVLTQSAGQIGNPVTVPGIDKPVRVIRDSIAQGGFASFAGDFRRDYQRA